MTSLLPSNCMTRGCITSRRHHFESRSDGRVPPAAAAAAIDWFAGRPAVLPVAYAAPPGLSTPLEPPSVRSARLPNTNRIGVNRSLIL
jgi:hypothetical protein